jgi:uncharacterized protein
MSLKTNCRNFAFVLAVLCAGVFTQAGCVTAPAAQNVVTVETSEGPRVFHIELADDPDEQEIGLMNRTSMPKDAGMLFEFPKIEKRAFWMKDTMIPLDMIFIAEDGTIQHIHHMARPLDRTHITSESPVKAVLEINGGLTDTLGIKEGDKVIHPIFRNQLEE